MVRTRTDVLSAIERLREAEMATRSPPGVVAFEGQAEREGFTLAAVHARIVLQEYADTQRVEAPVTQRYGYATAVNLLLTVSFAQSILGLETALKASHGDDDEENALLDVYDLMCRYRSAVMGTI